MPRCTKSLESLTKKVVWSSEKGSSLAHCVPLFKKNRCKSVLALKRSITMEEAVEVVSVRHGHQAKPRAASCCNARSVPGPTLVDTSALLVAAHRLGRFPSSAFLYGLQRSQVFGHVHRSSRVAALIMYHIHAEQQQILCVVHVEQGPVLWLSSLKPLEDWPHSQTSF